MLTSTTINHVTISHLQLPRRVYRSTQTEVWAIQVLFAHENLYLARTAIACGNADLVTCFASVSSLFPTVKVDRYELYELRRGQ